MIKYESRLKGVHPDLVKIVKLAATYFKGDIIIIQGVRSEAQHQANLKAGKSQTKKSRHVPAFNKCGMACAVDMAPLLPDGKTIPWKDWGSFQRLDAAVQLAEQETGIPVTWGGGWTTLKDGNHWELPRSQYP